MDDGFSKRRTTEFALSVESLQLLLCFIKIKHLTLSCLMERALTIKSLKPLCMFLVADFLINLWSMVISLVENVISSLKNLAKKFYYT